ncbi:MAG: GcrA family cell cycle regulator [Alphaproteobacteria bacterium]|nr:GcrA family cell cycle regulator [Alphaproteobacteria bacterium]
MLRTSLDEGKSFSETTAIINAAFGTNYSRSAVIGRADRLKLSSQNPPNKHATAPVDTFDISHDDALRAALASGQSFSEAAASLNASLGTTYTSSALKYRARRLGIRSANQPTQKKSERNLRNKNTKDDAFFSDSNPAQGIPLSPSIVPADRGPVPLLSLRAHHCRAPMGDIMGEMERGPDGLPLFCGARRIAGSSYCEAHHKRFVAGHVSLEKDHDRQTAKGSRGNENNVEPDRAN